MLTLQERKLRLAVDQEGRVRGHEAHLPPTNTTKIHVHVEQFSQKTNWKQAEGGEVTCLTSQCIWLRCC